MELLMLHDTGIAALSDTAAPALREASPGYAAWTTDGKVVFGSGARERSRLSAGAANCGFWDMLGDAVPVPSPQLGTTNAELAFLHLCSWLRETPFPAVPGNLVLGVPDHYDAAQLGMVASMVREAGLEPACMIRQSLCHGYPRHAGEMVFLDISLRRGTAVRLLAEGGSIVWAEAISLPSLAREGLMQRWGHRLAERFVHEHRFDPLGNAQTDQQLADLFHACLVHGREPDTIRLSANGRDYATAIPPGSCRDWSAAAVAEAVDRLRASGMLASGNAAMVLTGRAMLVPGLRQALEQHFPGAVRARPVVPQVAALGLLRPPSGPLAEGAVRLFLSRRAAQDEGAA